MHGCCSQEENCCGKNSRRSFLTKEEKVEMLKEYRKTLEKEVKGISERIEELQK